MLKTELGKTIRSRTTIKNAQDSYKPSKKHKPTQKKPEAPPTPELEKKIEVKASKPPAKPKSEPRSETNRKGSNFNEAKIVSVSSLYKKFLEYCKNNRDKDDITSTLVRHSTNKKKSWRRIVMDTIDILIRMGVIK